MKTGSITYGAAPATEAALYQLSSYYQSIMRHQKSEQILARLQPDPRVRLKIENVIQTGKFWAFL
jgi:hypothetical protein